MLGDGKYPSYNVYTVQVYTDEFEHRLYKLKGLSSVTAGSRHTPSSESSVLS